MATWLCVKRCGACCHLDPTERPELEDYLCAEELEIYLSLVGADGWCIHFDRENRDCRIYSARPRFCRVRADVFQDLYGVEPEELNDFAIDCCQQQIEGVYGDRSPEMERFNAAVGWEEESGSGE
ncbi:YkgJ family cysteine cluster protein [Lyngbya sp. CCY1209]|uniref:YkgJ family cysteine cluster protein n=1 Tax=Lyngbya sp. CCY1209 TaxID=2886103 RepID=UPI002D204D18|nr:YkgJ family cysteine cluster protein [Lyngbya sp. CCY1209]MEB3887205.1 YkgJ family cysteine cluster protein [Lyngbya sp. CCY1209]